MLTPSQLQEIRERTHRCIPIFSAEHDRPALLTHITELEAQSAALKEQVRVAKAVIESGRELLRYAKTVVLKRDTEHGLHNLANALNRFDAADQSAALAALEQKGSDCPNGLEKIITRSQAALEKE